PQVNFALYSANAEAVELVLLDEAASEIQSFALEPSPDNWWSVAVAGAQPGQRYAYRVDGPWKPEEGLRFDRKHLLNDPYAREVRRVVPDEETYLSVVHGGDDFDWRGARKPGTPLGDSVILETHVKGFTRQHPEVAPEVQGTYLGLIAEPVIEHFKRLGVTAVELLPCTAFVSEPHLSERGMVNYWGYNSLNFFAPHPAYGAGDPVNEFKTMVRGLHEAGIEVILDVAFNHTAEGGDGGPTLSYRGIDNLAWYWLTKDKAHYLNYSGCGNTLSLVGEPGARLVIDALRYWVTEMQVDGFRFDLAPVLGREGRGFDPQAALLKQMGADPVLRGTKLIAEPWDVGPGGYCLGQFPAGWSEWNDRYRDTVRSFWRGDHHRLGEFAERLSGSSDLYHGRPEGPAASINLVTAHDGFTLRDLVSYSAKHNEANGEDNRDGHSHNLSWNCGVEGHSIDPDVRRLRLRYQRSLLATLLLSQGVPMLLAGDEAGRTQGGNNNAYCQDNAITWHRWHGEDFDESLVNFVGALVRLRREHSVFRRRQFFRGAPETADGRADVMWLRPDGWQMNQADWQDARRHALGMFLTNLHGAPEAGVDAFLLLFNGGSEPAAFELAGETAGLAWRTVVDTAADSPLTDIPLAPGSLVGLKRGAMVVLQGYTRR
ncbi:MAG: glycogen debranching protein GlgX, partial [Pseudomonadota bacterium]